MVWMVIAIPLVAVVVGLSMLSYSLVSYDGLVADDYYKQGKTINRRLERQARAQELGLNALLDFQIDQGNLVVKLTGSSALEYPDTINLHFHHSTRASLDVSNQLTRAGDDTYISPLAALADGKWYVFIENDEWKLSESMFWGPDVRSLEIGHSG